MSLIPNTIRQRGVSGAGREVECNSSLTLDNGSGHIIVLLVTTVLSLNESIPAALGQRAGQQSPALPGESFGYRFELAKYIFPDVEVLVILSVSSSQPCNLSTANMSRGLCSSFHTYYVRGKSLN